MESELSADLDVGLFGVLYEFCEDSKVSFIQVHSCTLLACLERFVPVVYRLRIPGETLGRRPVIIDWKSSIVIASGTELRSFTFPWVKKFRTTLSWVDWKRSLMSPPEYPSVIRASSAKSTLLSSFRS